MEFQLNKKRSIIYVTNFGNITHLNFDWISSYTKGLDLAEKKLKVIHEIRI